MGVHRITMRSAPDDDVRLTRGVIDQLVEQLDEAAGAATCRVVVIEGRAGSFCSGMDLTALAGDDAAAEGARRYADLLVRLRTHDKITVAAVDGLTFGGGVGLAAATDLVVATERSSFGLPEATLGLVPAMVLPMLVERMAPQKARRMALLTTGIDVFEALRIGLVDEVVGDAEALERRLGQLTRTAGYSDPLALRAIKGFAADRGPEGWREGLRRGSAQTSGRLADPGQRRLVAAIAAGERPPWRLSSPRRLGSEGK